MKTKNSLKLKKEETSSEVESDVEDDDSSVEDEAMESGSDENEEPSEDDEEDLAASETESDEDDGSDMEEQEPVAPVSKEERIRQEILQKYQEVKGKQLYIRFPHKIPEKEAKLLELVRTLSPLIVKAHKPRQRHARFCLVDFETKENRDLTLKVLEKKIRKGELAKHVVNIPKTESDEFVNELTLKRIQSYENKKAKLKLKKASKNAQNKKFSSTLIITNLPKTASALQVRELFPTAVDVQIKANKGSLNRKSIYCSVTLPSTMEARNMTKQKLTLGGVGLVMKFDSQIPKKKNKKTKLNEKHKNPKQKVDKNGESKTISPVKTEKADKKLTKVKNNKAIKKKKAIAGQ